MIMSHLVRENLLSNKRYGFISGRSTTTQLLHYLDRCAEAYVEGDVMDVIYFDFAKASRHGAAPDFSERSKRMK